jgi:hypothetical protein
VLSGAAAEQKSPCLSRLREAHRAATPAARLIPIPLALEGGRKR